MIFQVLILSFLTLELIEINLKLEYFWLHTEYNELIKVFLGSLNGSFSCSQPSKGKFRKGTKCQIARFLSFSILS